MSGDDSLKAEMLPSLAQYWSGQSDFHVRFSHWSPADADMNFDLAMEEGLARLVRGVVCKPDIEKYKKAVEESDEAFDELEIAQLEYEATKWTVGEATAEGVETAAEPAETPVGVAAKVVKAVTKAKATQLEHQAAEKALKRAEARYHKAFAALLVAQDALRACFSDWRIYIEVDYEAAAPEGVTGQGHLEISGRLPANFPALFEPVGGSCFAEAAGHGSYTTPVQPLTANPPPCVAKWSGTFEVGVMIRSVDQQQQLVEVRVEKRPDPDGISVAYSRDCGWEVGTLGADSFLTGTIVTQGSNVDKFRFILPKQGQSLVKVVQLDRDPQWGVASTWRIQLEAPPKSGT
jgi:hypothetical protein